MTLQSNSAEGGTNGTTVTTGNSGGSSGGAWDAVSIGAGGDTLTFDNTRAAHGGLSYKFGATIVSVGDYFEWNTSVGTTTDEYIRFYLYRTANPVNVDYVVACYNGGSLAAAVAIGGASKLNVVDSTNTTRATTTNAITLNAWVRVEVHFVFNATTGSVEIKLFNTPDSATPTETLTKTSINTGTQATIRRFGDATAVNVGTFWMDDIIAGATAYPGPYVSGDLTGNGIVSSEAFGTPVMSGALTATPTGIVSSEAFGTPVMSGALTADLSGQGIASSEAFGTPVMSGALTATPDGITTGETFGTPVATYGVVVATPTGIATSEAFGTPVMSAALTATPDGIATTETFGTPAVSGALTATPTGVATSEAFGTPVGSSALVATPTGIASGETFGTPFVTALSVPAVVLIGASGTFYGMASLNKLITEQTFNATPCGSWAWPNGKGAGWCTVLDGFVYLCGQDYRINALFSTGVDFCYGKYDPVANTLTTFEIPTTKAKTTVVGSNGKTGGAYNADVQVVEIDGVDRLVFLSSGPYQGQQIGVDGLFPTLAVVNKDGSLYKSYTADDIHNLSDAGAKAFPYTTDSYGETYASNPATDELDLTPVSKVLISPQYFGSTDFPQYKGGMLIATDPQTGKVLARYVVPFTPRTGVTSLNPRSPIVCPLGTNGYEPFAVVYDVFNSGADAGYNILQFYAYDHILKQIIPLSNWLRLDTSTGGEHWSNGVFDTDGWFWIGTRASLAASKVAVFPMFGSLSWQVTGYPFAWVRPGQFAQVCLPNFLISTTNPLADVSYDSTRMRYDPATQTCFYFGANSVIMPIKKEGDAYSPKFTTLPVVDTGMKDVIQSSVLGNIFPMDAEIDFANRRLWWPFVQLETASTCPVYPCDPYHLDSWLVGLEVDRVAQTPIFGRSTARGEILGTSIQIFMPARWIAGDIMFVFLTIGLTSANPQIATPSGWTQVDQWDNGTVGNRYALFYRIMQTGDPGSVTFSWGTPARNGVGLATFYRGFDASAPILTFARAASGGGGGSTATRPSVTPGVEGSRILGWTGSGGIQTFTSLSSEISRAVQSGTPSNAPSALATEEEVLGTGDPTGARNVNLSTSSQWGAITVALAPAPAASAPYTVSDVSLGSSIVGGGSLTGTVSLSGIAERDTAVLVSLATNDGNNVPGLNTPLTVLVPAGASKATFQVDANYRDYLDSAVVTARTSGTAQAQGSFQADEDFCGTGVVTNTSRTLLLVPS